MRKKGSKSSPIAMAIKSQFGMTLSGYAVTRAISYPMLCHLAAGTGGAIYGPAGVGAYGAIANQLKKDNVWVDEKEESRENS